MAKITSRYCTCFFIALIAFTLAMPNLNMNAQIPHVVYGYVFDTSSAPIAGVTVFVNNTATGDTLNSTTDNLGRYLVGIDSFPSNPPYLEGQILSINAVYHNQTSSANLAVTNDPLQIKNLTLNLRTFIIHGYINNPDTSDARYFVASITNTETNETVSQISDFTGYYRKDLATFINGFDYNDGILVTVNQAGLFGQAFCIVGTGSESIQNITLADVQEPIPSIYESPSEIILGQNYRILLSVSENYMLANVKIFIKKNGQPMYNEISMIRDDGTTNDWNGDGQPNIQIYGQSTSRDLDVQESLGDLFYYFTATDVGNNTASLPPSNPESNPYLIRITDQTFPVLTHTPITYMENWVYYEFLATATDNVAVSAVNMYYRLPDSVSPAQLYERHMLPTGNPNEYNTTLRLFYLGTLEYYLVCNDTGGNTARIPVSGFYPVVCADTVAPTIYHTAINSANVGSLIYYNCSIPETIDPWFARYAWLNYTDVHGDEYNASMSFTDYYWHYTNASGQDATGIVHYTISANDTSGNIGNVSHAFPVYDPSTPMITHVPPEMLDYNTSANISVYAEDNLVLTGVKLAYKPVGGSSFTLVDMVSGDLADGRRGNFTAEIPPQTDLGTLEYYINATDGTFNISWPALSPSHMVEVVDRELPILAGLNFTGVAPANIMMPIRVNVSDNYNVSNVAFNFLGTDATSWQSIPMTAAGAGVFEVSFTSEPDHVSFYISAGDPSWNNATLPASEPKLNPFTIVFYNTTIPQITVKTVNTLGVNRSTEAYIVVANDRKDAAIELLYRGTQDVLMMTIPLTIMQNGTYSGIIPAQSLSGTVQVFAQSRLNSSILNQTQITNISVTNQLPVIQHIGVESAPVGESITIVAIVSDDLHVENVTLSMQQSGDLVYLEHPMLPTGNGFYSFETAFSEPTTLHYHINAADAEGDIRWPVLLDHDLRIMDLETPVIEHTPILNLTTEDVPVFFANVTDNIGVTEVELWYRNSGMAQYASEPMTATNGAVMFSVSLDPQPEGNFTYYITAQDGVNNAVSPLSGEYSIVVESIPSEGDEPWLLIISVLAMVIVISVLVAIHIRRKSINDDAESGDGRDESDEITG